MIKLSLVSVHSQGQKIQHFYSSLLLGDFFNCLDNFKKNIDENIKTSACLISMVTKCIISARKTDIIRVTEQILDAISSGDFEGYTYVSSLILNVILCILNKYFSSLISSFYIAFFINITTNIFFY